MKENVTTEDMFDLPAKNSALLWKRDSRADYMDGELVEHDFKYKLNRELARRFPNLLIDFAEDFDHLVSMGPSKTELKSLVRLAYILADGGGEYIKGLFERLDYRDDIVERHYHIVREVAEEATQKALDGVTRVEIDDCIDPHGYYVYILWDDTEPIYVGQSANVLNRLGAHMGDSGKRADTRRVQLVRCDSREKALEAELTLIEMHRPRLNIQGNPGRRL